MPAATTAPDHAASARATGHVPAPALAPPPAPPGPEIGLLVVPEDVGGPAAFQELVRAGALRRLWGDVAAPASVPVTPTLRALAVRDQVPRGTVLAGAAAAWVLCGSAAPRVLDVVHPPGRHRPPPRQGRAARQAHVLRDETTLVAGVLVTSVQTGRAPCRERVWISVVAVTFQAKEMSSDRLNPPQPPLASDYPALPQRTLHEPDAAR